MSLKLVSTRFIINLTNVGKPDDCRLIVIELMVYSKRVTDRKLYERQFPVKVIW